MASIEAGWRAYAKGDVEKADKLFAELVSESKQNPHPYVQRGLFQLRLDRFADADESFQSARQCNPKNAAPVFFQALAKELNGEAQAARDTVDELRALSPHHQGISSLELLRELRTGDPSQRLSKFGFGPPTKDDPKVSLLHRLSAGLGVGDPSWLPSDLTSSDYLLGPILIEIERKLHPLEVPKLEEHAPPLPEDLDSFKPEKRSFREEFSQLKNIYRAGPILKKGKSAFERSYDIQDREKQTATLKKAALYLRLARKINPYAFRVSYHLGETYIFLARNEPGTPYSRFRLLQAQGCFVESAQKEGINPYLLFYVAYIQHLLGRPKLAILYYREATKRFEKLPEAHYGEGQCELLLGNKQKAKELMLKAVNSDLALARERLDLFANLLAKHGIEHFDQPFPSYPEEPKDCPEDPTEPTETQEEPPQAPANH